MLYEGMLVFKSFEKIATQIEQDSGISS